MDCPECGDDLNGPMMFGEFVCGNPECGYVEVTDEYEE